MFHVSYEDIIEEGKETNPKANKFFELIENLYDIRKNEFMASVNPTEENLLQTVLWGEEEKKLNELKDLIENQGCFPLVEFMLKETPLILSHIGVEPGEGEDGEDGEEEEQQYTSLFGRVEKNPTKGNLIEDLYLAEQLYGPFTVVPETTPQCDIFNSYLKWFDKDKEQNLNLQKAILQLQLGMENQTKKIFKPNTCLVNVNDGKNEIKVSFPKDLQGQISDNLNENKYQKLANQLPQLNQLQQNQNQEEKKEESQQNKRDKGLIIREVLNMGPEALASLQEYLAKQGNNKQQQQKKPPLRNEDVD